MHMYLDIFVVVFPLWPFISNHAFPYNALVKVKEKFKVKVYASLHNDLYLRESL